MAVTYKCPHCGHSMLAVDSHGVPAGPCEACGKLMLTPGEGANRVPSARFSPARTKGFSDPLLFGMSANGLILLFLCVGSVVAVLIPALNSARESARLNSCTCNGKNLALSLHNYHDIHGRLPLASSAPVSSVPGVPEEAGYSWIVQLLPYMEEQALYDQIVKHSRNFDELPFDSEMLTMKHELPIASNSMSILVCPSARKTHVDAAASGVYKTGPFPAISNYIAATSSTLLHATGPIELVTRESLSGSGVLVFPTKFEKTPTNGLSLKSITDGTTTTLFFCESREEIYAAWIDGQATWGVAAWPENDVVPPEDGSSDGFIGWPDSNTAGKTSLEAAYESDPKIYMAKSRFGGSVDRKFGPSSHHPQGLVHHAFADGHVVRVKSDVIDRSTYLRLYTRGGGEPVGCCGG